MKALGLLLRGFGLAGILLLATPVVLLRLVLLLGAGLFVATILNEVIVAVLHPVLGTSFQADVLKWLLFGAVYLMGIATPLLIWADMSGLSGMLRASDRYSHGSARFATRKERAAFEGGDPPSTSYNVTARDLMTPDEIMQLPPHVQLLRIQGKPVMLARKLRYFADREFDGLHRSQDA